MGLEVRQQPNFLDQVWRQKMSFVDYQNRSEAVGMSFGQHLAEKLEETGLREVRWQVQAAGKEFVELGGRQQRVEDVRGQRRRMEGFERVSQHGRFTGTG